MSTKKTSYNPQVSEPIWQNRWETAALFQDVANQSKLSTKEKLYLLFAFAYPSGVGLHVGHVESKTALDILARFYRMNQKEVFFPVGWDAFGLPAENYAVKTGVPPAETTKAAITTFRRQIKRLGISYDWATEIATCHPGYYRWTQWLFLKLFEKGLAYRKKGKVNWCPSCQTVLANEQVVNGTCERCGSEVIQKDLEQWYFKITEYQDELITGLDQVDWPEPTKQQQLNWIGRKTGIEITYQIENSSETVTCFTTRPDTNFGATFIVLAPEHPLAQKIAAGKLLPDKDGKAVQQAVSQYLEAASKKSELDRQMDGRKKTGVFTGFYAKNNLNDALLPIWISDFVLAGFGTGAVVGVPGHDLRDFQFAKECGIPIKRVVIGPDGYDGPITEETQVQEEAGTMVDSGFLNGMHIQDAIAAMMDHLEEKGWGKRVTTYKLRDWLISRQRYWGAPIPVVYDPEGNPHPVKEEHLPWLLPTDVEFKPTGESPLTHSQEFKERTERLYGKGWRPEYDTMDTFVDSSWYFLRYPDSRNESVFASPEKIKRWQPVDLYMIGPEHIVLHLLYSRFFTKFLRDEGHISFSEPFLKMRHQGMILGPDGRKMSKSKGNVINPDEVVEKFGADTLRVYEMFMGPLESDKPWSVTAVAGVYRFLTRLRKLILDTHELAKSGESKTSSDQLRELLQVWHETLKKVTQDIPARKFNTAIAAMMTFVNAWDEAIKKQILLPEAELQAVVLTLAPFAPFLSEELWEVVTQLNSSDAWNVATSVHLQSWPTWDDALAAKSSVTIPVQVNGKVRAQLQVASSDLTSKETILTQAKVLPGIKERCVGHKIKNEIYVPGKIINLVID